jgi:hypothetical protein
VQLKMVKIKMNSVDFITCVMVNDYSFNKPIVSVLFSFIGLLKLVDLFSYYQSFGVFLTNFFNWNSKSSG